MRYEPALLYILRVCTRPGGQARDVFAVGQLETQAVSYMTSLC